jgi:transcriptional regulator with XRE-family HTH domain
MVIFIESAGIFALTVCEFTHYHVSSSIKKMQEDVDLKTSLKERLVFRRNGLNLTQASLAECSGLSERSISDYERGLSLPSLEQLIKLAEALDVRPGYLLGEETILEAALLHDRPQRQDVGGYSSLETSALEKILADLSGKLPRFSRDERKHVLGNLRSVLDVLEERELTSQPKTVTGITPQGIVREEHADLRGVSSKVGDRVKRSAPAVVAAANPPEDAALPSSSKAASTSGSKSGPSLPTQPRKGHEK